MDTPTSTETTPAADGWSTAHSRFEAWRVVVLLAVVNLFNFMDRFALSVLAPAIKEDLGLSDGQLGLLVGFAFSLFFAVCSLPIARWADRGVRRDIVALGLVLWSGMTALCGTAQTFIHLFVARMGVGLGEAGCLPAQSIICDYVPPRRRSSAFAVYNFGAALGVTAGMALAGWLASEFGWRWAFLALGLPGIVFALVLRVVLKEPVRGGLDPPRVADLRAPRFLPAMAVLSRNPAFLLLCAHLVLNGFIGYGISQWLPSFLTRSFDLPLNAVGAGLGIAMGVAGGIGLLLGGFLADRVAAHDSAGPLKLAAGCATLALPAYVAAIFAPNAPAALCLIGLGSSLAAVSGGPVLATLYSVTPASMRVTAGAVTLLLSALLGYGLGPVLVGFISDALAQAYGPEALRYALLAPVALLPLLSVNLLVAGRAARRQIAAAAA